ncbi:LPXTG cell wall anchor domain-containing protein [Phytoactinopolyspora alkaliphila]|uniref:LPXTG cell wall anchor domain-containing protein n=1 Tax=Phytoactinopolyspora alkaliphila TaxID=1783498 RepID=A0A6N9YPR4_9ACTN|nr:LPXTG cell wall anchor domain-containing protein [Phytoactinopolyspora alkaliphila]NED97051.1 LPXTG cell wall anchor domain-containing protein [Phytoactinopolyspora alkaliphila]
MRTRLTTRPRRAAAFGTAFAVAAALTVVGTAQAAVADDTPHTEAAAQENVVAAETAEGLDATITPVPGGSEASDRAVETLADDPQISMEVSETSEWAMKREGLTVFSWGFTPGATVTITVDESVLTGDTANSNGELNFSFTAGLAPGEYTITLTSSEEGSASHQFTVIADGEFYDDEYTANFDPAIQMSRWVVSESELTREPISVTGSGFPNSSNPVGPTTVDLVLDGELVETVSTDIVGAVATEISGPLSLGTHEVALVSPVGEATRSIEVVSDEQGTPPAAGSYIGTSVQTHADGVELDEQEQRPFSFEIDDHGRISGIQGEYWWYCSGGSGFKDLADARIPATPMTADRPFEVQWHDFVIYGAVNADGTASGTFWDGMGECGSSVLNWNTEFDGDRPDPDPVYDPEATVSPESLTVSELANTGVVFAGTRFAPESDVTLTVAGTEVVARAADADGDVEFPYTSDTLGAGSHEAVLSSVDGEASVTLTVTKDADANPGTIPGIAPGEDDLDPALEGKVTAPAEAEPGETITVTVEGVEPGTKVGVWLFSDVAYLGTHVVDENGQVRVTIPKSTDYGNAKLGVWAAGDPDVQIGWTALTIIDGNDGDGDDDPGSGSGAGTDVDGDSDLPATGSSMFLLITAGALLLVAGVGLVLLRVRSRVAV